MALIPTTQVSVSPDDYRRKMAYALLQQGSSGEPVQHWTQGLNRIAQGLLGGYQMYQDEQKQKQDEADATAAYLKYLQGGSQPAPSVVGSAAVPQPAAPTPVAAALAKPAQVVSADPAPVTGPRPNGPVMPSPTVWGDKEAEDAGLYEKKPTKVAMALASPLDSAQWPYGPVGGPSSAPAPAASAGSPPAPAAVPASTEPQTSDTNARIAQLLNSSSKAERMLGRSLAEAQISQSIKPETTDELKEYKFAKSQGYKGSFVDFKTELKKAGATNVNVDTKGENAFATEAGKSQAKRFNDVAEAGQGAKQMLSDVQTLTALGNNIQTGKLAEAKAAIGPYAQALGIDVKGLSEIQAFDAIVNRVAPSLRVPGSGAQSDFELKNFLKSLPSLGNTAEGNAITSKVMTGLQQNKIAAAEIAQRALTREITPAQADKMIRDLPDPMEDYRAYLKQSGANNAAPKINSLKKKYGLD